MKIGDVIESAIWMDGRETTEQKNYHMQCVCQALDDFSSENGFTIGPVTFVEKLPGGDRAPKVPKHIETSTDDMSRIRMLVGETKIHSRIPIVQLTENTLVASLGETDLNRLREITRTAYRKHVKGGSLTNAECDAVIEELGPDVAIQTLRDEVSTSLYH